MSLNMAVGPVGQQGTKATPVVITTSTSAYATRGGCHTDVDTAGTDWVMLYSLANTRMEFWYSWDGGVTWGENTLLRKTLAATAAEYGSAFYIAHDIGSSDECVAFFVTAGTPDGWEVFYCRVFSSASTTWTSYASSSGSYYCGGLKAFDAVGDTVIAVVIPLEERIYTLTKSTSWGSTTTNFHTAANDSDYVVYRGFDFEHDGDGRTPVVSGNVNPYTFHSWAKLTETVFTRGAYTVGEYRADEGTARQLSAFDRSSFDAIAGVFDGDRYVTVFIDDGSDTVVQWYERNLIDTVTTDRSGSVPALSDGAIAALALGVDANQDVYLYAVGVTLDNLQRLTYDRSGNSFGSWETIYEGDVSANSVSVQPGYQTGNKRNVVWRDFTTNEIYFLKDG